MGYAQLIKSNSSRKILYNSNRMIIILTELINSQVNEISIRYRSLDRGPGVNNNFDAS